MDAVSDLAEILPDHIGTLDERVEDGEVSSR
jgi:hypothetical protein